MNGKTISEPAQSSWTEPMLAALGGLDYHIVNLLGPPMSTKPQALGLNPFGGVAGKAYMQVSGDPSHLTGDTGVTWTAGVCDVMLPATAAPGPGATLPRFGSSLNALNWHGVAVGWREDASGNIVAIHVADKAVFDMPWTTPAIATGINDAGLICGWTGSPGSPRGFVYDPESAAFRHVGLAGPAGGAIGRATAINNLGEVVGESGGQAFIETAGKAVALGAISQVTGVNDAGIVVGSRSGPSGEVPVLCDARTTKPAWAAIPLPPPRKGGQAEAVNRFGHVVGSCWDAGGRRDAFIHKDGFTTDLNLVIDAPNWHLETATDINDRGQICGNGTFAGQPAAFLLTPIRLELPPSDRRWPIELPDGPPRPDEAMRRDGTVLIRLNQAATSIVDTALRERVRTALSEAGQAADAQPADSARPREKEEVREPAVIDE